MAELLEISPKAYARMERNESSITMARLEQIAKVLEVNTLELLAVGERHFYYIHTSKNEGVVINNGTYQTPELKDLKGELEKYQIMVEKQSEEISHLKKIIELMEKK